MSNPRLRRLFSYGGVGLLVTAIYAFCTVFFVEIAGFQPTTSSGLAYLSSFLVSFFANHHFVFRSKRHISNTAIRFMLVSAIVFFLSTSIMYLTVEVFGVLYLYGVVLVLVVIPLTNFLLHSRWTFRDV